MTFFSLIFEVFKLITSNFSENFSNDLPLIENKMDCRILKGNLTHVINDGLIGLTCLNQEINLFDFGNVIVRKDYFDNECVRIVSGGSNSFGEFVGKGMLTASIQGEGFMAPPSKVILRTIRELSLKHIKGILVIIPANLGDLLNFGLAAERAINDNIRVKLLPVDEDSNKNIPKLCKIGLSGVVFVQKIAGALAEKEKSLKEIYTYCQTVLENISSSAIIFKNLKEANEIECICKKNESSTSEPSKKRVKLLDIHSICRTVIEDNLGLNSESGESNKLNVKSGESIVVLLNNTNGLGKTEEHIFVREFLKILENAGVLVKRFYVGNFFKCSRMIDMTVTIMKIFEPEILEYLDYPCSAPGWRIVNQKNEALTLGNIINGKLRRKDRLAPPIRGPKLNNRLANILLLCAQFACDAIISCEKQLNIIDAERGDGDTGTRLKNACEVLLKRMGNNKVGTNYPFTFFESLSRILEAVVGGVMGCIYSIAFEAAANCFGEYADTDEITPLVWLTALEKANEAIKIYGNVNLNDGTMYDPMFTCAQVVREELESGKHYIDAFGKGVSQAEVSVERTKKQKMKYPDPGAHAVGIWMRALFEGVKLRCPVE